MTNRNNKSILCERVFDERARFQWLEWTNRIQWATVIREDTWSEKATLSVPKRRKSNDVEDARYSMKIVILDRWEKGFQWKEKRKKISIERWPFRSSLEEDLSTTSIVSLLSERYQLLLRILEWSAQSSDGRKTDIARVHSTKKDFVPSNEEVQCL